jgi:hypothetical protein
MVRIGSAVAGVVVAVAAAICPGAVIQMSNPSFEGPDVADGGQQANPPGWVVTGGAGYTRDAAAGEVLRYDGVTSTNVASSVLSKDGEQVAKLDASSAMYMPLLGYTFANGQNWQLAVDVAWPSGGTLDMRFATLRLTTADQLGTFVPAANASWAAFGGGTSVDGWTTLQFNVTLSNATAFVGKTPVVEFLTSQPTGPMYFDNLRGTTTAVFDASALPEPGVLSTAMAGLVPLVRRRRSRGAAR